MKSCDEIDSDNTSNNFDLKYDSRLISSRKIEELSYNSYDIEKQIIVNNLKPNLVPIMTVAILKAILII